MGKITTSVDFKNRIQELECKQVDEWALLKNEFLDTCEIVKPINILKSTIKEAYSAPNLKANIVNTVIGIATGFVGKRILIGKTRNPFTKLLGVILEVAIANKVAKLNN